MQFKLSPILLTHYRSIFITDEFLKISHGTESH